MYEEHSHLHDHATTHAHKYDIALVELSNPIIFDDDVQPACLPESSDNFGSETCWLTGWGATTISDQGTDRYRLNLLLVSGSPVVQLMQSRLISLMILY